MSTEYTGLDKEIVQMMADYLAGRGKLTDSQYMDMRTDIRTTEMMKAISYYRLLDEHFKSSASKVVADLFERLSIASTRLGRKEALLTLMQRVEPKSSMAQGMEEFVKEVEKSVDKGGKNMKRK